MGSQRREFRSCFPERAAGAPPEEKAHGLLRMQVNGLHIQCHTQHLSQRTFIRVVRAVDEKACFTTSAGLEVMACFVDELMTSWTGQQRKCAIGQSFPFSFDLRSGTFDFW